MAMWEHSLVEAELARDQGRIRDWIGAYLRTTDKPNLGLWAKILERRGDWLGPAEVCLSLLTVWHGTNPDQVREIAANIKSPRDLPPIIVRSRLIVTAAPTLSFRHQLEITDGGHRWEACRRNGYATCWALIEINTEFQE